MASLKCSEDLKKLILNTCYPIGHIWVSMNSTNPKNIVGGTWVQITDKFLYCRSTDSKVTGGSTKTGETKLTAKQSGVGNHGHGTSKAIIYDTGSMSQGWWAGEIKNYWTNEYKMAPIGGNDIIAWTSKDAEEGHTHNQNLPPYITCYAWYRTA